MRFLFERARSTRRYIYVQYDVLKFADALYRDSETQRGNARKQNALAVLLGVSDNRKLINWIIRASMRQLSLTMTDTRYAASLESSHCQRFQLGGIVLALCFLA